MELPTDRRLIDLYLEVVRKALQHTLYRPMDSVPLPPHVQEAFKEAFAQAIADGVTLDFDPLRAREDGRDNDAVYAQTMTSKARLHNVRSCIEAVLRDDVPGDFIEAGVWRGGIPIYMRAVLTAYDVTDRSVVLADSFEGLPPPDPASYPADRAFDPAEAGRFAADLASVQESFRAYDLLDDRVEFVKGWFSESLASLAGRSWSILRLDGDLYESTWDCLVNLYAGLSPGGFVIIDDWVLPPCRAAVEDFRGEHGITDDIIDIDWASAYWRRSR